MTNRVRKEIIAWTDTLSDEQLEKEYYDYVYKSLGTQTERMYDLGYDMADIKEREEYEKEIEETSDILEYMCEKRGIKLWNECNRKDDE